MGGSTVHADTVTDPTCSHFQCPLDELLVTLDPGQDGFVATTDWASLAPLKHVTKGIYGEEPALLQLHEGIHHPLVQDIERLRDGAAVVETAT